MNTDELVAALRDANPKRDAPAATGNVVYVLHNGGPEEWAVVRKGDEDAVGVYRFDNVPDDVVEDVLEHEDVSGEVWSRLLEQGDYQAL